jgi:hypothetical protein
VRAEPPAISDASISNRTEADIEALRDTLVRVSHLAMHLEGQLAELDINPLMVLPSGQGVKAADALVVLCRPGRKRQIFALPDKPGAAGYAGSGSGNWNPPFAGDYGDRGLR